MENGKKKSKFFLFEISVENRQKNNPKNLLDLLECRVLQNSPRRRYSSQWHDVLKEQTWKEKRKKKEGFIFIEWRQAEIWRRRLFFLPSRFPIKPVRNLIAGALHNVDESGSDRRGTTGIKGRGQTLVADATGPSNPVHVLCHLILILRQIPIDHVLHIRNIQS